MAEPKLRIIGVISRKLPRDLANQLFNEFESRLREANFLIDNYSFYRKLKKDSNTIEVLLALSIFHKRVITNLDAAVKFHGTIQRNAKANSISIGNYEFDNEEKNKLLGLLINYKKLKARFGITDYLFEYNETKDFLKKIINFKSSFDTRRRHR